MIGKDVRDILLKKLTVEYKGNTYKADDTGLFNLKIALDFIEGVEEFLALYNSIMNDPNLTDTEKQAMIDEMTSGLTQEELDTILFLGNRKTITWWIGHNNSVQLSTADLKKIISKALMKRYEIYKKYYT